MATNFLSQLGGASAGIGSAIKNLYTMPSQVAQAEAQARLRSAQEAQLRQAMQQTDFDNEYKRKARLAAVGDMGDIAGALDLTQANNIKNGYGMNIYRQAAGKMGLMPEVGDVIEAHNRIQQQRQQPQVDSSYGEDASVIRPISALGNNSYVEAPASDNAQTNDVADFLQKYAALEGASKGSAMYNNVNRQGIAQNKYFKDDFSIEDDMHRASVEKERADADKKHADARKADRWVPSQGRGGHGGGHRGPRNRKHTRGGTPPKSGYERLKDIAIKNNWSPEKFAEEATKRGFIKK